MKPLSLFLLIILLSAACRRPAVPQPAATKDPFYDKGLALLDSRKDSAFYYFNKVVSRNKDSLQTAKAYNLMSVLQSEAGDYFGAQESLSQSLKQLSEHNPKHRKCLAADYNELGLTSATLRQYADAISYYDKALGFCDLPDLRLRILNNKALAYEKMPDYPRAIRMFQQVLLETKPNRVEYARTLSNLTRTQWLHDPKYPAVPALLRALAIRQRLHDSHGENASYAHLSDYYLAGRRDSALVYSRAMYRTARQIASPDDQLQALQKLIRLEEPAVASRLFIRYLFLNDSLQHARNAAKNQFALIRYQVEKNRLENLQLQKDNAEKKYQLVIRDALLVAGFALLVILVSSGRVWYSKWKKRKEQEKQEAILETRRKASKDVHDSLSNDIYLLMKRIKHDPVLDRDELRSQAEYIYKRSRDVSYELLSDTGELFPAKTGELLKSFGTEDTKISLVGNSPAFWQKVSTGAKSELKLILQELMVNMEKHSRAANVVVKFESRGNAGLITYMDDGTGIPEHTVHQNGLTNTGTRINAIRGRITFGNNDAKGLKIEISFPFI
ncbi:MAG: histidine kinase [Mucilaginibacter sp.]|nr:histidine kinase [Mucilaginibacter sp.]